MRIKSIIIAILLGLALAMVLTACGSKSTTQAPPSGNNATVAPTTAGSTVDGATLLNTRCTVCHSLSRVQSAKHTAAQWTQIVSKMIRNGAKLNSNEEQILIDYLAKTYGS